MKGYILWLMQTNRNKRPQSIDEFVSEMEEVEKPALASSDGMMEDPTFISEECITINSKQEETIIENHPAKESIEEQQKIVSPVKGERIKDKTGQEGLNTTNNKENNNCKGHSGGDRVIIGWLVVIAFLITLIGGGILFSNSQSNSYPASTVENVDSSEAADSTAAEISEYVDRRQRKGGYR